MTSYNDAYKKWDYTKKAMDHWARLIRQRLDEAHGEKAEEKLVVEDVHLKARAVFTVNLLWTLDAARRGR